MVQGKKQQKRNHYSLQIMLIMFMVSVIAVTGILVALAPGDGTPLSDEAGIKSIDTATPPVPQMNNIAGSAYNSVAEIPTSFSPPWDPATSGSDPQHPYLSVRSTPNGARQDLSIVINNPDAYVYQTGYYANNTAWTPFTISSTTKWSTASKEITLTNINGRDTVGYVIIFVCKKYSDGQYTCGTNSASHDNTPQWTIQNYSAPTPNTCLGCTIDGTCYANNTVNPANACKYCDNTTATSKGGWSNNATGRPCAVAGTGGAGTCNGLGTCTPSTGTCTTGCLISGTCYANNTVNPANACQQCNNDTATGRSGWSNNATICTPTSTNCGTPLTPANGCGTCVGTGTKCTDTRKTCNGVQCVCPTGTACGNTCCTSAETCNTGTGVCTPIYTCTQKAGQFCNVTTTAPQYSTLNSTGTCPGAQRCYSCNTGYTNVSATGTCVLACPTPPVCTSGIRCALAPNNPKQKQNCNPQANGCMGYDAPTDCGGGQLCVASATAGDSCQNPSCSGATQFCSATATPPASYVAAPTLTCLVGNCYTCGPGFTRTGAGTAASPYTCTAATVYTCANTAGQFCGPTTAPANSVAGTGTCATGTSCYKCSAVTCPATGTPTFCCPTGNTCGATACAAPSCDECTTIGAKQCVSTTGGVVPIYDSIQTCTQQGSCKKWSAPVACGGTSECVSSPTVQCGRGSCVPKTCPTDYPGQCGRGFSNGCGGLIDCTCTSGTCSTNGIQQGTCSGGSGATCASLGGFCSATAPATAIFSTLTGATDCPTTCYKCTAGTLCSGTTTKSCCTSGQTCDTTAGTCQTSSPTCKYSSSTTSASNFNCPTTAGTCTGTTKVEARWNGNPSSTTISNEIILPGTSTKNYYASCCLNGNFCADQNGGCITQGIVDTAKTFVCTIDYSNNFPYYAVCNANTYISGTSPYSVMIANPATNYYCTRTGTSPSYTYAWSTTAPTVGCTSGASCVLVGGGTGICNSANSCVACGTVGNLQCAGTTKCTQGVTACTANSPGNGWCNIDCAACSTDYQVITGKNGPADTSQRWVCIPGSGSNTWKQCGQAGQPWCTQAASATGACEGTLTACTATGSTKDTCTALTNCPCTATSNNEGALSGDGQRCNKITWSGTASDSAYFWAPVCDASKVGTTAGSNTCTGVTWKDGTGVDQTSYFWTPATCAAAYEGWWTSGFRCNKVDSSYFFGPDCSAAYPTHQGWWTNNLRCNKKSGVYAWGPCSGTSCDT